MAAQAQMQAPRFGVKAGANYSGFTGDKGIAKDRLWGFHAGVTAQFPLTSDNFFAIQPEVLYSQKGAESKNDSYKVKVSYIDVPVLAHVNAGPLYFEAGPQVSFRVAGEIENNGTTLVDDLDMYKHTSFGYAAGIGLATPLGVSVGVRYNGDFSQLNDNDNAASYKNSVFMLSLGYTLPAR